MAERTLSRTDDASVATAQIDAWLAALLRGEAQAAPPPACVAGQSEALWQRIEFHGIAYALASGPGAAGFPAELRQRLAAEARLAGLWEETHRTLLVDLLDRLGRRGIAPVLMKGTAMAYALYPDPAARRRGDTDLLVRPAELETARAELASAGLCRREDPHGLMFQETWLAAQGAGFVHAIDLHWQVTDSPVLQQVLPLDEYCARSVPLPRLAAHARAPDAVLGFIQNALNQEWHAAHGYFVRDERPSGRGRLIWALDNHLAAARFSEAQWDDLVETALARRVAGPVAAALDLARTRLSAAIPAGVRERLAGYDPRSDRGAYLAERDLLRRFRADFAALPSLRAKAQFALGHALAPEAHLRRKYPASARWPAGLLQARRIAAAAWRLLVAGRAR